MAKSRLKQFIELNLQAAVNSNGFAHEIHLSFVELGRILEHEFDYKKDKMKTDIEKLFGGKIPSQKELLYVKYPNCAICGKKFNSIGEATKDHIKPKAKGGLNDITNLQLTCLSCNSRKGDFYDENDPSNIVYVKNKTNVRFMLEESNLIEDISDKQSLEDAYQAWNYLWAYKTLTPKAIKRAHFLLVQNTKLASNYKGGFRDMSVYINGHIKTTPSDMENDVQAWLDEFHKHTTFEQFKADHIQFEYMHPFLEANGRLGRMLMNWQLAKQGLPLHIFFNKDKEQYFDWFKDFK